MALATKLFNCKVLLIRDKLVFKRTGGRVMLQRGLLKNVSEALRKPSQLFPVKEIPEFPRFLKIACGR
jgi:hypothetical protein